MTSSDPPQQARTPRRLRVAARTRVGRRALSAALAGALTIGGLALAGPVRAEPTPSPSATTTETVVGVAPAAGGILRAESALTTTIAVDNGTGQTGAAVASLALGTSPLPDRASLAAWLAGTSSGVATTPVGSPLALSGIPAGGRGSGSVTVAADDPALLGRGPGVYPLLATVTGLGAVRTATSVVVVPDNSAAATPVALIVPVTAGARSTGLLTAAELTQLTAPGGALTARLDAVAGTTAVLAIDPAVVASIRALGTSAPGSAVAWLTRLSQLPNPRFALQFGDADVSVQVDAGLASPLTPTSLVNYTAPADFASIPEPAPTTTPSPSPSETSASPSPSPSSTTPAAEVDLPTLSELLDVSATLGTVYWTPTGTATGTVVGALATSGGTAGTEGSVPLAPLSLVASTSTAAGVDGSTVAGHATSGGAELGVYDAAISQGLRQVAAATDDVARAAAAAGVSAGLAFATAETGGAPLLVTIDRPGDVTAAGLTNAVQIVTGAPRTAPTTLAALRATPTVEVALGDSTTEAARTPVVPGLLAGESALATFATVLDDPALLTGRERAEILQLLGAAWLPDTEGWTAAIEGHTRQTDATLHAVSILPPTVSTLVATDSHLGIWIRNDLPWPVNVVLEARPDNLRLEVQHRTPVDAAPPTSNTRVFVPVQAKVGNGEVTIRLSLESRTGVPIGASQQAEVNVRADWERIGLVVLGAVILALVVTGVVRTVRRRRRRTDPAG